MRTITSNDMARIAENLSRRGCQVYYQIGGSDRLYLRYGKTCLRINEGDNYKEALDKAQELSRIIYQTKNYETRNRKYSR